MICNVARISSLSFVKRKLEFFGKIIRINIIYLYNSPRQAMLSSNREINAEKNVRRCKISRCMFEGFCSIRFARPTRCSGSERALSANARSRESREGPTKEPERVGETRRERH